MRYVELANCTQSEAFDTSVILVCLTIQYGMDLNKEREKELKKWQMKKH